MPLLAPLLSQHPYCKNSHPASAVHRDLNVDCTLLLPILATLLSAFVGDVYAQLVLERRIFCRTYYRSGSKDDKISQNLLRSRLVARFKGFHGRRTAKFVGIYVVWLLPLIWVWRSVLSNFQEVPELTRRTSSTVQQPEIVFHQNLAMKAIIDQAIGAPCYWALTLAAMSMAKYWRDGLEEARAVLNGAYSDVLLMNWLLVTPVSYLSFLDSSVGLQLTTLMIGFTPMAVVVSRRINVGQKRPVGLGRLGLLLPMSVSSTL